MPVLVMEETEPVCLQQAPSDQELPIADPATITLALERSMEAHFQVLSDKLHTKLDTLFDQYSARIAPAPEGPNSGLCQAKQCSMATVTGRRLVVSLDDGMTLRDAAVESGVATTSSEISKEPHAAELSDEDKANSSKKSGKHTRASRATLQEDNLPQGDNVVIVEPTGSIKNRGGSVDSIGSAPTASWISGRRSVPQTPLGRLEASKHFETVMGLFITLNCITMGWQAHVQAKQVTLPALELFFTISEHLFTAIFTLEVATRFTVRGFNGFSLDTGEGRTNLFDAILVFFTGTLVTWIIPFVCFISGNEVSGQSLRTLTVFRAVRFVRLLRVFRSVYLLREAWMLICGLQDSVRTLFWTIVVIALVTYVYAIFGLVTLVPQMQTVRQSLDDPADVQVMDELLTYVGGLDTLMLTLVQVLTLDSVHGIMRNIMPFVGWSWIYFYAYIAVGCFVLMNLVTAIIVNNALSNAQQDQENAAMEMEVQLKLLFSDMDTDENGTLSWEEFQDSFRDPAMSRQWMLLDFEPRDCKELFDLLDAGDGEIDTDDFFEGLGNAKGPAQAKDILKLQKHIHAIRDTVCEALGTKQSRKSVATVSHALL